MKKITTLVLAVLSVFALGTLTSCKDECEDKMNDLRAELLNQNSTLRELLEAQKADLQGQINALKEQLNAIKSCTCDPNDIKTLNEKIKELQEKLIWVIDNKADTSKVEELIKGLQDQIDKLSGNGCSCDLTDLKKRLDELENALANKADKSELKDLSDKLNTELGKLDDRVAALETAKDDIYKQIEKINETIILINKTLEGKITELNDAIIIIQNNIKEIQAECKATADNLQKQIDELKEKLEKINKKGYDDTELRNLIRALTGRVSALERAVEALNSTVETLQGDVEALKTRMTAVEQDAADALAQANKNKEWIEKMEQLYGDNLENLINVLGGGGNGGCNCADILQEAKDYADQCEQAAKDYADGLKSELEGKIDGLDTKISEFEEKYDKAIENLQEQIDNLKESVEALEKRIENAEAAIEAIKGDLAKLVTSIAVNGAINEVTGFGAAPVDMRTNILATWYGTSTQATRFPQDEDAAAGFSGSIRIMNNETLVSSKDKNGYADAGKIYVTLNPYDKNFTGVVPTLVNSQGEVSAVELSALKYSDDVLSFGYTRGGDVNGFYEASARVNANKVSGLKPAIDLASFKNVAKDVLSPRNGIDLTNLFSTVYKNMENVLPALAVKIAPSDKTSAIISQYGVAATAIPALSYDFLRDYTLPRRYYLELPLPDEIKLKYNYAESDVQFSPDGNTAYITYKDENGVEHTITIEYFAESINAYIEGNVNELIDQIKDQVANKYASALNKSDKIVSRINNLLDRAYNFVEGINSKLQPVLVYDVEGNGVTDYHLLGEKLYAPTKFKLSASEGILMLHPTSYTAELIAPAYKKYVAVTNVYKNFKGDVADDAAAIMAYANNTEVNMNTVFDGCIHTVGMPVNSSFKNKVLEITYSAVDYCGVIRTNKYYVMVK